MVLFKLFNGLSTDKCLEAKAVAPDLGLEHLMHGLHHLHQPERFRIQIKTVRLELLIVNSVGLQKIQVLNLTRHLLADFFALKTLF